MKVRSPLVIANVVIVVCLYCSVFLREGILQGSDILDLTDAISIFGVLTWFLVGALWLAEQARRGRGDADHGNENRPPTEDAIPSSTVIAPSPVITAKSEVEGTSGLRVQPPANAVARYAGTLLSSMTIVVAGFSFYQVFAQGMILSPLFTWAYWVPLLGGHLIFRHCTNRLSQLGYYLLLVVAAGPLFAVLIGQMCDTTAYLGWYAVEAAVCLVALLARDFGRASQAG